MWQVWAGRILVFSNVVVLGLQKLLNVDLSWWNGVYALATAGLALLIGSIGKKA